MPALKADLLRLGIGHMGDLVPRRIAGSKLFDPWMTEGPVNSDYFPIVDLYAARSRFTRTDAIGLIGPRGDNLPVMELLEHRPWDSALPPTPVAKGGSSFRHELALQGEDLVRYLLAAPGDSVTFNWVDSVNAARLHAVRGLLLRCEQFNEGDVLWDEVVVVANRTLGTMSSARQKPLWDAFLASPCYPRLSTTQREWLQLFAATGARDAPAMARLGTKMLAERAPQTPRQWAFLVTASAVSQWSLGNKAIARKTLVDNWPNLDNTARDWPTMELLLRLTTPPAAQPAR